ncbi:MAG: GNAT family N-acetyltransferase [Bacteroidota bacterium]|jgi:predicted GNAT family acetyltransferase
MTTVDLSTLKIENNQSASRWEARVGDYVAFTNYRLSGDTIHFLKTRVPPELEGQGVAGRLVKTALDDARTKHLTVVPICRFVASYIRRHAEYRDLVYPDFRHIVEG